MELRKQLTEEYHYATYGALPSSCGRDRVPPAGGRRLNGRCLTMQIGVVRRGCANARETELDKKAKIAKIDVDLDEGNTLQTMSANLAKILMPPTRSVATLGRICRGGARYWRDFDRADPAFVQNATAQARERLDERDAKIRCRIDGSSHAPRSFMKSNCLSAA
jgi:hypothetical protein